MAMTTSVKPRLTYDDYASLPDDERYELIDGELMSMPSPKEIHQAMSGTLFLSVGAFVRAMKLGKVYFAPFDVILSDIDVVQPDLIFVSDERSRIVTEDNIRGAPDLVVEILSPSTADHDRMVKRDIYARHGVSELWLIDPYARTVTVLTPGADGYDAHAVHGEGDTLTSPTLTGFSLDLSELFTPGDPS